MKGWVTVGSVISVLILILIVALPSIQRASRSANEGRAIGTLRILAEAQAQFQANTAVDQDGDGVGEFGLLNELTGVTNLRGPRAGQKTPLASAVHKKLTLAVRDPHGYAVNSGFYFQVFLPHVQNVLTDNGQARNGSTDQASINAQENNWIAYAWPKKWQGSGVRCFTIDQAAEVASAPNVNPNGQPYYDGSAHPPSFKEAMCIPLEPKKGVTFQIDWDKDGRKSVYKKDGVTVEEKDATLPLLLDSLHWRPSAYCYESVDGQSWVTA